MPWYYWVAYFLLWMAIAHFFPTLGLGLLRALGFLLLGDSAWGRRMHQ